LIRTRPSSDGCIGLALAYALGPISGCHLNPAVTLGMALAGRTDPRRALGYVAAQLTGGLAGAGVVLLIAQGRPGYTRAADGLGANGYGPDDAGHFNLSAVLLTEVALTMLLVLVVLATTERIAHPALAGIPIGFTLVVIHLIAIPIDGSSVNPARSIGPALLGDQGLGQLRVFIAAPMAGALLAALLHRTLFANLATAEHTATT